MKKIFFILLTAPVVYLTACGGNKEQSKTKLFPRPGTVVASAQMPILGDTLNHFTFAIKVIADSNVSTGMYDVDADFGPNFATSQFSMPKGIEDAKPVIRKGSAPYSFIIGFKLAHDTTFYDYFEVSSNGKATRMQYIKAYTF